MTTNRSKTIRSLAASLPAAAILIAASPAAAMPPGGGGGLVNEPPVAKLKASPHVAIVSTHPTLQAKILPGGEAINDILFGGGDLVSLDASGSTDDEGVANYAWDLDGNGSFETNGGSDSKTSTRFYTTGEFVVKVRVKDSQDASDIATQKIVVHHAPHAALATDLVTPLVGQEVKYDASGSTGDPGIKNVTWDLDGDGTFETDTGTSLTAGHSYTAPGPVTVKVRIADTYGVVATASVTEQVNQAPTAAFTNTTPAFTNQTIHFDGSSSSDDAAIADYAWDLDGDGTFETDTGASPMASKVYTTPGTVNPRLRVTDSLGATSIVTHPVIVATEPVGTKTGTGQGSQGGGGAQGQTLSDTFAPKLSLAHTKVKLGKNGKVRIRVACPATERSCTGRLVLRRATGKHANLGTVKFTLAGGQAKTFGLLLPAVQRASIRRSGHAKAQLVITVADAAGNTSVSTRGILIGL